MAIVTSPPPITEHLCSPDAFPDAVVLRFHHKRDLIGTSCEGVVAFNPDGSFLSANPSACTQLGRRLEELRQCRFESLFAQSLPAIVDQALTRSSRFINLAMHSGPRFVARLGVGEKVRGSRRMFSYPRAEEAAVVQRSGPDSPSIGSALDQLATGDPQVAAVLTKLRRVIGRDIPVLIHGETGTGKELLAHAIHDESRRKGAFVAVNCAAIPDGLIESELFGYDEGAFTGARRKGYVGRIMQADGGTLFLDEIGDMPLSLQARMLRVLQERVVTPLCSLKSFPVNIALICATHQKLREWVAAGKFREDLYYRLNGFSVTLPPLRQRSDIQALVESVLTLEVKGAAVPGVAPEVIALFERHPWPGNIRQLANVLRTALVMAGENNTLLLEHVPDEFYDDLQVCEPEPPPQRRVTDNAPSTLKADLESLARRAIQLALDQNKGNISAAARQLRISRNTLYRKMQQA